MHGTPVPEGNESERRDSVPQGSEHGSSAEKTSGCVGQQREITLTSSVLDERGISNKPSNSTHTKDHPQPSHFASPSSSSMKSCDASSVKVTVGAMDNKQQRGKRKAETSSIGNNDCSASTGSPDECSCETEQESASSQIPKKMKHFDVVNLLRNPSESQGEGKSEQQTRQDEEPKATLMLDPATLLKWMLATNKPLQESQNRHFRAMIESISGASCPSLEKVQGELSRMKVSVRESLKKRIEDAPYACQADVWRTANDQVVIDVRVSFWERERASKKWHIRCLPLGCRVIPTKSLAGDPLPIHGLLLQAKLDQSKCLGVTSSFYREGIVFHPPGSYTLHLCLKSFLELCARMFMGDVGELEERLVPLHRKGPPPGKGKTMGSLPLKIRACLAHCAAVVEHFREAPKAVDKLKESARRLGLRYRAMKAPVGAAWWSELEMCESILANQSLVKALESDGSAPGLLKKLKWNTVEQIVAILRPLRQALRYCENDQGILAHSSVPTLVYALRGEFRRIGRRHELEDVRRAAKDFLVYFEKRWIPVWRSDESKNPAILTRERFLSACLDPRLKHLPRVPYDDKTTAYARLETYCSSVVRERTKGKCFPPSETKSRHIPACEEEERLESWDEQLKDEIYREILDYRLMPRVPMNTDPLQWWEEVEHFPILRMVAKRFWLVSATSTSSDGSLARTNQLGGSRSAEYLAVQNAMESGLLESYPPASRASAPLSRP